MGKKVCTVPFEYMDTPERRAVSLEGDGIGCVPVLGLSHFAKTRPGVAEHRHPGCIEITLCLRGALAFEIDGTTTQLLPKQILIAQPGEKHRLAKNPNGLVMYWMFFRIDPEGKNLLHLPKEESDALRAALETLPRKLVDGSSRVRNAFARLFGHYDALPAGSLRTFMLRGTVLELLLALMEERSIQAEAVSPSSAGRLAAVIREMEEHPERDYPSEELERRTALSGTLLNTRFKKTTGLPPHAFLVSCRLKKALSLLRTTSLSVTQIAYRLGFSSSQHFATHFRRFYGVTPSEVRHGKTPV